MKQLVGSLRCSSNGGIQRSDPALVNAHCVGLRDLLSRAPSHVKTTDLILSNAFEHGLRTRAAIVDMRGQLNIRR